MIIYKGKSLIDSKPIVVIATGLEKSANAKTGNMVQTWILADNGIMPHENVKSGDDVSVCGDCKHRPSNGGACYVKTFQAPRSIYNKYLKGGYESHDLQTTAVKLAGRRVRLGAYGDPAAVPFAVWNIILSGAAGWTGYTHQWQRADFDSRLMLYCMASVDNEQEAEKAHGLGYRYFRVRTSTEALNKSRKETICPASEEAGRKLTCAECKACSGLNGRRKSNIAIIVHGALATRFKQTVAQV